jgi:sugar phosphate isomerase/epimerase
MPSLGLGHFTFLELDPVSLVRLARKSGFDFVGLRFHPVAPGQLNWLPDAGDMVALAAAMADEGIGLYDIETVVIDATFEPVALLPALDAAARLGARRLNACADAFPALPETFSRLCALAGERGMGVDIECMAWRGIDSPAKCRALIDESGADNAGFLVDALHLIRCGGSAADLATFASGQIRSAQLCDAPSQCPTAHDALIAEARGARLLPGDGGLPLRAILNAMPPETTLSVELPNSADTRPPLDRARAIHRATWALFEPESQ